MEKAKVLEQLIENTPLVLIIFGVAAFILGAAGGLSLSQLHLSVEDPWSKYALMALGALLVIVGALLLWKDRHESRSERMLKKDYGFQIDYPAPNQRVPHQIRMRGKFRVEPADGLARILEFNPSDTSYYPKPKITIDKAQNTWFAEFSYGGNPGDRRVFFITLCGSDADRLFDYHALVGNKTNQWVGIPALPADVIKCAQVEVELE